jgi:protein-tyrosine phosphatase
MAPAAAAFGLDLRLGYELTPHARLLGEDLSRYALGGIDPPAVLIEFTFEGSADIVYAAAEHAEQQGLLPVLAHPERSDAVLGDPSSLDAFAARGWPLQLNGSSLLGRHGAAVRDLGWRLLGDGAAALVGSDGHRSARPPYLDEAYAVVTERLGSAIADPLFDGSALIAPALQT